jgi:hypothetical protein
MRKCNPPVYIRHKCYKIVFIAEHENHLQLQPAWNPKATRRKVIANYWFREVLMHFGVIMAVAVVFTLPQFNN